MDKTYESTLKEFRESIENIGAATQESYENKAQEYADERGIIFYEIEGNTMTYEEQVKDSRTSYGLYIATVNLDTGEVTQEEAK